MKYVTLNGLTKALSSTKSYIDSKISSAEKITYIDLFLLKEQSKLSPGKLYRIIDYQTTTIQEHTQAAGHQFDVVVLALDENTLSEEAWVCKHDGDYYFQNSNLSAWKIWYSLENDTNRFAWAKPNNLMWGIKRTAVFKWSEYSTPAGEEDMIFTRYPEGDAVFTGGTYSNMPAYAVQGVLGDKTVIFYTEKPLSDNDSGRTLLNLDGSNDGTITRYYVEESYAPEGQEDVTFIRYSYADTWVQEGQYSGSQLYAFMDLTTSGSDAVYVYTMDLNYNSGYDICDNMGNFIGRITYGDSKGVIYRMIDEYNNDCPYDFKNIQLYSSTRGGWHYTFNEYSGNSDASIIGLCYNNHMGKHMIDSLTTGGKIQSVNFNIIEVLNNDCYNNKFGNGCSENYFGYNCYNNKFGNGCSSNTLGNDCYNNKFGNGCSSNTLLIGCYNNKFGNSCSGNTLRSDCHDNKFGNSCRINDLGSPCSRCIFGHGCLGNTLGSGCYDNKFGNGCSSNTLGSTCIRCSFGNGCSSNNIKTQCSYNNFEHNCSSIKTGSYCTDNKFESGCNNITFGNRTSTKSYISNVTIKSKNMSIYLTTDSTTSSSNYLQNIVINKGVNNSNTYSTINVNTVGQSYQIDIAKDSSGNIKQYCVADLIN